MVRELSLKLWLADERTFVLGWLSNLDEVPVKPAEGIAHLPAELRDLLETRLAAGTPLWAAGHAEKWDNTLLPIVLANLQGVPVVGHLKQVKSFAIGLVPDNPVKVQGSFRCTGEAAAKKIAEKELAGRAEKEPDRFKFSRDGAWLDVQWKIDWKR
jgi:hypothetical protein